MSVLIAHSLDSKPRTQDVLLTEATTFDSLLLSKTVMEGLSSSGFQMPAPIQLRAIPVGRCGFDLIVKSKSGTGKTLVFTLIALEMIDITKVDTQVLILVPTREISVQIQSVLQSVGSHFEGLRVASFIGGLSFEADVEKCKSCHIAVGTPGRVKHLINEGILKTEGIHLFVLDEADKLMELSFQNDINDIFNSLPERKQIIATSATYPNELESFLADYMLSPTHITVEGGTPLLLGLKQFIKVVDPQWNTVLQMKVKNEITHNILSSVSFTQCLIFSNYQSRAESISNILKQKGWNTSYISGAQPQKDRLAAVDDLKNFRCRILLSTDITARGIDAANVDLVINYDVPVDAMTYLHRMGRAGRFGSTGVCINLAFNGDELEHLQKIMGIIGSAGFSIPVLPDISSGGGLDLLNIETSNLSFINGIITHESLTNFAELKNNINSEVTKLKQAKKGREKEKNIGKSKKKKLSNSSKLSNSTELESTTVEMVVPNEVNENVDCLTVNNRQLMHTEESTIKPFEMSDNDSSEKQGKDSKNIILMRNKAMFSITKILDGSVTENLETKDVEAIGEYLRHMNDDEMARKTEFLEDNKSRASLEILHNDISSYENVLENIFEIGYKSATKKNAKHWKSYISEFEKKLSEKLDSCSDPINDKMIVDSNFNTSESNDDFSEEARGKLDSSCNSNDPNYDFMKWVPVEESDKALQNSDSRNAHVTNFEDDPLEWIPVEKSERAQFNVKELCMEDENAIANFDNFHQYYEQCSDTLWQTGLSFDNVVAFDEWFYYEWQAQLHAVRNYTQQNIYVDEMSRYKQRRKTIKNNY